MLTDLRFARVLCSFMFAGAIVAALVLHAASVVGADDVCIRFVKDSLSVSKNDVMAIADDWKAQQQRGTRSAPLTFTVSSDIYPSGATYIVQAVVDVRTWGVVVVGETVDGTGRVYTAASSKTDTTHVTVHHQMCSQKMFVSGGSTVAVSTVRDITALPDESAPIEQVLMDQKRSACSPSMYTDRLTGRAVVRVGVLHTPEILALRYYGGNSEAVRAEVAIAVATANIDAFPSSGIDLMIELCANELITGSIERSRPSDTLRAFSGSSAVETVRVANKCDTMVLFSTMAALGNRACGIGYLPGAHAVVAADCFVDNYSFLHEFGHNVGACHGPPSRPCGAGANGYGDATNDFRTILAYHAICGGGNCTRIPRYSNKKSDFNWNAHSIGNSVSDNAWILNANKDDVASRTC